MAVTSGSARRVRNHPHARRRIRGLRRVPRAWKPAQTVREPEWVADDKNATPPELIEPPIVLGAARPVATTFPTVAGLATPGPASPQYAGPAAP